VAAERRGYEHFRTEQPPYSILVRGIEPTSCRPLNPSAWASFPGAHWPVLARGKFGEGKKNTSRRSARLPDRYDLDSRQPAQARSGQSVDALAEEPASR